MSAPEKNGLKLLFKERGYVTSLVSNTVSRLGDSIDSIAFGWLVYQLTGSTLLMGSIFAVSALPNILFGVISGVFVDRLPKKPMVVLGHVLRGIFVSLVALLFMTNNLQVWMLFVFAFLNSTVESFAFPASSGLFQRIVPKDLYLEASSFSQSASSLAELIGLGVAGVIIAFLGIGGAILIDAGSFFFAALGISTISVKDDFAAAKKTENSGQSASPLKTFFAELKEGVHFVWNDKLVRITVMLAAFTNFALSPFASLQPAYVKDVLLGGPVALSLLGIALTLGIMIGSLTLASYAKRFKPINVIIAGFFIAGVLYTLTALPVFVPGALLKQASAFVLLFLFGASIPLINATVGAYLMQKTPKEFVGRTNSVLGVAATCAMPIGCALSGAAAEYFSIPVILAFMGVSMLLVTFIIARTKSVQNELRAPKENIGSEIESEANTETA